MFESSYAKNLANPKGFWGLIVSKWLDGSLDLYVDLEKHIDLQGIDSVLEIGFGTGVGLKYFSAKYPWQIYGIDHSGMMLKRALSNNSIGIREGKVHLRRESIEDDRFIIKEKHDLVFGINILCFIFDLPKAIKKLYDCLKEGGNALFFLVGYEAAINQPISSKKYFIKRPEEELLGVFRQVGFRNVSLHEHEQRKGRYFLKASK